MKKHFFFPFAILFILATSLSCFAQDVWVNGYYKNNGTYVQGHHRSAPDGNFNNNWSTKGNTNPYTGQKGYKTQPSYGAGILLPSTSSPTGYGSSGSSIYGSGSGSSIYGSGSNNTNTNNSNSWLQE